MPHLNFNSSSPALKLVITLMSIITIGIIVWFMGFLFSRLFFSIDVPAANNLLHGESKEMSLSQIKYYQILQVLGFFIIPGIFLQWLFSTPEKRFFNIEKIPINRSIVFVGLTIIVGIPLINYLVDYNQSIRFPDFLKNLEVKLQYFEQSAKSMNRQLLSANSIWTYFINILMIAVLPAIGEEFIFRGVFQKIFLDITKNKHMAVVMAAILFSILHVRFFAFIPLFLLGVFFGYLLIWSKTIWLPVFAHFINNAIAVTLYYFQGTGIIDLNPEKIGLNLFDGKGVAISAMLVLAGIFLIHKIELGKVKSS